MNFDYNFEKFNPERFKHIHVHHWQNHSTSLYSGIGLAGN